jgi:hypothetical protein
MFGGLGESLEMCLLVLSILDNGHSRPIRRTLSIYQDSVDLDWSSVGSLEHCGNNQTIPEMLDALYTIFLVRVLCCICTRQSNLCVSTST